MRCSLRPGMRGVPRPWRASVGAASGRDAECAGRGLRSRVQSRASPLPRNLRSVPGLAELLWERPLAAMRAMPAAGFVRGCNRGQARSHETFAPFPVWPSFCGSGLWPRCGLCRPRASFGGAIAGKPAPTKPSLRSRSGRAFVGAASGRDAGYAGRGLRSRVQSRASPLPRNLRSVPGLAELLRERPMPAAGFVRGCNRGQARSHETFAPFPVWPSFCGSGLWPRCGICTPQASFQAAIAGKPAPTKPWLRSRPGRAFVGAASGRDAGYAGRRLRSRPRASLEGGIASCARSCGTQVRSDAPRCRTS